MPGYDGTGPAGKGPMTGQGRGYCIMRRSAKGPQGLEGFVGLQGASIRKAGGGVERLDRNTAGEPTNSAAAAPGLEPYIGSMYGQGGPGVFPYGYWINPWLRRGFGLHLGGGFGRGRGRHRSGRRC